MSKKRKVNQAKLDELQGIIQELEDGNERRLDELEKLKDVQRIEFDYFKHLSTLSTGSTMILIAFIEKAFRCPRVEILALLSVICFAVCMVFSLMALQSANNLVLCPQGIRMIYATRSAKDKAEVRKKKAEEVQYGFNKLGVALKSLRFFDRATLKLFVLGIVLLLVFVGINFFN